MSGSIVSRSDPPPPITAEDAPSDSTPRQPPSLTTERVRAFDIGPIHNQGGSQPAGQERPNTSFEQERKQSSNLKWHEEWSDESWKQGRVFLVDYIGKEYAPEGKRKVISKEFRDAESLRSFYRKKELSEETALRVIHVQNAPWATRFLLGKFNIDVGHDVKGTTFGRWAQYERPLVRNGRPVPDGKAFRTQRDPWRGINRASFSCDYLRYYAKGKIQKPKQGTKLMELNGYDGDDLPCYAYDALIQRLSVYVQLSNGTPGTATDPDIPNPYNEEEFDDYQRLKKSYGDVNANEHKEMYMRKLNTLDNGNTIIIFESSQSGDVKDTLIGARQQTESHWRRLAFYLSREGLSSDKKLTDECVDLILKDIFKAVARNWEHFFSICEEHVGILEDKIYDNPADESRDQELWSNSALWLKIERLVWKHLDIVKDMQGYMYEIASGNPTQNGEWLSSTPSELERLTSQWERDIIGPTNALADLMYKSVGIRDSRHSLQLGLSMWRLSWITFIFLPLTFVCGLFGMNVDTFENNPPMKYFWITAIPVLSTVLVLWYGVKHSLSTQRQNPLRRGVYEALYNDLANNFPHLWTRNGPKGGLTFVGTWGLVKWRLVTRWFGGDKLQRKSGYDPAVDEFGAWSRIKQHLARRWLPELRIVVADTLPQSQVHTEDRLESVESIGKDLGAVAELMSIATPVALAEANSTAAIHLQSRIQPGQLKSISTARSEKSEGDRPGSEGEASDVMIDEEAVGEGDQTGDIERDWEIERLRQRRTRPDMSSKNERSG